MKKCFIAKYNTVKNSLGLIEKSHPKHYFSTDGMGIAHDCLEHYPNDKGSIADECMALGCSLWIRGLTNYNYKNLTPAEGTAIDFYTHLWGLFIRKEIELKPVSLKLKVEPLINTTVNLIPKGITHYYYKGLVNDKIKEIIKTFVETCTYWLQIGFNKAKKKYKDNHKAGKLFIIIETLVNNVLEDATEGQEFIINYCISKCTASIKIKL